MLAHLRPAVVMLVVADAAHRASSTRWLVTGLAPARLPAPGQRQPDRARTARSVGSALIGQPFADPRYFWGRPSATAPCPYNAAASAGSNLGPDQPGARSTRSARPRSRRCAPPTPATTAPVPVDLVTASAQRARPAHQPGRGALPGRRAWRGRAACDERRCAALVARHTEGRAARRPRRAAGQRARAEPGARRAGVTKLSAIVDMRRATDPIPMQLLARVQADEARAGARQAQGLLRRLRRASARPTPCSRRRGAQRAEGVDVVVGWVETHGRAETEALLAGPRACCRRAARRVPRRRRSRSSTSTPPSRAGRRCSWSTSWPTPTPPARATPSAGRTSRSCSTPGIDVYTTLNVQHLESLNDVVAQITGVAVRETVPDSVLERGRRGRAGRPAAGRAARSGCRRARSTSPSRPSGRSSSFFRKGNLIALRELALRRTAERSTRRCSATATEHAIAEHLAGGASGSWSGRAEPLRGAAGPGRPAHGGARPAGGVDRRSRRDAGATGSSRRRTASSSRARCSSPSSSAARRSTLTGEDVVEEMLAYARRRNVTRIVVGKPAAAALAATCCSGSFVDQLLRRAAASTST